MSIPSRDEYDGLYFLPGENEGDLTLSFFKFNGEVDYGKPIESSDLGDKFHIAFFKRDGNGHPVFDEHFEAIFVDPATYVKNFVDSNLYGCILRKTEKSQEWWKEYLTNAINACKVFENQANTVTSS